MVVRRDGLPSQLAQHLGHVLVTIDDLTSLIELLQQAVSSPVQVAFNGGFFSDSSDIRQLTDVELSTLTLRASTTIVKLGKGIATAEGDNELTKRVYREWARPRQRRAQLGLGRAVDVILQRPASSAKILPFTLTEYRSLRSRRHFGASNKLFEQGSFPLQKPSPTEPDHAADFPSRYEASPDQWLRHPALKMGSDVTRPAFICHSSGDKHQVRHLLTRLDQDQISYWFAERDLIAGQEWEAEIRKAIRAAAVVVAFLSEASVSREGYINRELRLALDRADEQPDDTIFLIPVRLEPCVVPHRLSHLHYVDLFDDGGYGKLLHALRLTASSY